MAHATESSGPVAVVAGVGPGLGESLARKFHDEGCTVALFARTESFTEALAADLGGGALAVPCDVAEESEVHEAFEMVREQLGPVDILVNHASAASWTGLLDCSTDEFDRALSVGARGGFLCAREAVSDMLAGDEEGNADGDGADGDDADDGDASGGTVIFTGATTSVRGRKGAVGFSAAKFAARGLAESMARELGPEGIHVAHVVLDGGILPPDGQVDDPDQYLDPDAIAESYWHLVEQDRSAWTLELDLRPHVEKF